MSIDFSPEAIEARVQAAIRPQLDRCDELLDYYTEGLPANLWQPMALRLALSTGVWKMASPDIGIAWRNPVPDFRPTIEAINALARSFWQNVDHDNVIESQ